jgi:hypothetical protein
MRLPEFGEGLDQKLESLGVPEVKRQHALNKFHILDRGKVDAWLLSEEAKGVERADDRSEESLSISRKALDNSRLATRIAISAIVLSIIMATYEIIKWYSEK